MDEGSSAFMNPVLLLHTRNLYISQSLRTELDIYASRVGAAAAVKVRRQLLLFGVVSGFRREGGRVSGSDKHCRATDNKWIQMDIAFG